VSVLARRTVPLCVMAAVFGSGLEAMGSLHDGGELAAAAIELGASHPPGQPLHALVGYAFTWIPLGSVLARLSLLSVACVLLAALLAAQLTSELCDELGLHAAGLPRALAELAALLGVPLSLPVLRQSLRVEVYTLALALLLGACVLLARWARTARPGPLWGAALLSGLCMAVHPPHALAALLTAACLGALAPRRLLVSARAVLGALAFGVLGLCVLAYLPARAYAGAATWGDPSTLRGFVDYVSAQAYMGNRAGHDRGALLADYAAYLLEVSAFVPVLGALLLLWPRLTAGARRPVVLGFVLAAFASLLSAALQPLEADNPDNVAYVVPALVLFVVAASSGLAALAQHVSRAIGVVGLCLVALPPASLVQLPAHLDAELPVLETLSAVLAEGPPPRALVVVTSEHASTTWLMMERVERVRPDVGVIVKGLSTSSWHWARLRARPGLSRPRRVGGGDPHLAFTLGAVLSSLEFVPVALEQDLPGLRPNALCGPYALLDPRAAPGHAVALTRSMSERWLQLLSDEALDDAEGDALAGARAAQELLALRARRWQAWVGGAKP
jgi:hypothetical protein